MLGTDVEGVSRPNVDRGDVARTAAVVMSRWLWPPREEISITICASLPVLERVVKRGEVLEPPLDSRVAVSNFSPTFPIYYRLCDPRKCEIACAKGILEGA